ncbi:MAG: ABC transporter permease [Vicinamibacterales bacterium]
MRAGVIPGMAAETLRLSTASIRSQPARSALAVVGVVIGIVTVVLVASVLVGLRNSVALLFRELGTENVFAFHRDGDPYSPLSDADADRRPLSPDFARQIERLGASVRDVGVQLIVPVVGSSQVLSARAGDRESDTILVEGVSPNFFDVTGTEFVVGRPFTPLESRVAAPVAVLGANVARALFGSNAAIGRPFLLAGERYYVVGELAPRQGTFFGENRGDNVVSLPLGTAQRRFPDAEQTVLYVRARPGRRDQARVETETIIRILRRLAAGTPNDFNLSTADQIIAQFDRIGVQILFVTLALAAVSLVVGGIGIANVMVMSVTERTREIGLRLAVGARRGDIRLQFLIEAAILSGVGGLLGVAIASALGALSAWVVPTFPAVPPAWAVGSGLVVSVGVGMLAGYLPARRAASMDPVEALRHE